ncbi:MAG: 4Fe-4S dicluster domain-containing protein [Xanthobacteraceae bacterium]|jgi:phenylacetyl-CoA:acceptor oxidoreductase subunit 1
MTRWAMVADLQRCVGCQTCTAACKQANATSPFVQWRRVLDIEAGGYPNVSRTFVPVGCQHCADPPCMHVCPSTATRRRADGIVTIDYDICIGCAYCAVACPYQARFKIDARGFAYDQGAMQNEIMREDPHRIGVAQKCTFCSDRVDFGLDNGMIPGVDPQATPACVSACIADALYFGDIDDPNSNVSRLLRTQKHFRMHEEIGTEPGFYYVYDKGNGGEPTSSVAQQRSSPAPAAGMIRTRGVEPWHQPSWDWKAAGNFMFGGAGIGLYTFAAIATVLGAPLLPLVPLAALLVAIGLFLVLLKIGRPLRFAYVLRQPQRSWMAREAWVAIVFFPLAALAFWFDLPALLLVAAIAGLLFLFSQAMMLKGAKGIPAWRQPLIVPLIITTGLAEGGGLFLALTVPLAPLVPSQPAAVAVAILVAIRALAWRAYLGALRAEGAPTRTLETLDRARIPLLLLGLVLPIALIAAGFFITDAAVPLFVLGGICAFAAGWALKFILIVRAAYNQGYAIEHTPVHGVGIAGLRVQPGWSVA